MDKELQEALETLKNGDSEQRSEALDKIIFSRLDEKVQDNDVIPAIVASLEDEEKSIRDSAQVNLISKPSQASVKPLADLLSKEKETVITVLNTLGMLFLKRDKLDLTDVLDALLKLFSHKDEQIRRPAIAVFGVLANEEYRSSLKAKLEGEQKEAVAQALCYSGDKSVIPTMIEIIKDSSDVEPNALALRNAAGDEAKKLLNEALTNSTDKQQEHIKQAMLVIDKYAAKLEEIKEHAKETAKEAKNLK